MESGWRGSVSSPDSQIHAVQTGAASAARIRVMVMQPQQLLADALAVTLGADPDLEVVGTRTDPNSATDAVRRAAPDVVLVDQAFTRATDADVVTALHAELPSLRIIILAPAFSEENLFACIEAGAVACVSTDQPSVELVHSIKRVYAGEILFRPELLVSLLTRSRSRRREPEPSRLAQALAPRELEVLRTLATGMTTDEAAARLGISIHTVRTHLKNVMAKLEARSKLEAVMMALRAGLIDLPP